MNITHEQYGRMCREFPGIDGYIFRCELKNEFYLLELNEYILDDSDKTRLKFLRSILHEFNSF